VFEVGPTLIQESQARSLSYWDTANGDDTMVTVWNPADEQQDFVLKLSFAGGHYNFPIHLTPRASYTFNVSEVINNQIPDSEGNLISTSVHAGSADLEGTHGANEDILVAMDAGTYNVNKATCIMRCRTCHGAVDFWVQTVPFGIAVSGQTQLNSIVQYDSGAQSDLTSTSSWSSSAASIATVSSGLVHGLSPGNVTIAATSTQQPIPFTDCEPYTPPPCPFTPMQSSGGGDVNPTVTISGPTNIPMLKPGSQGSDNVTLTANANPTGGTYSWTAVSGQGNIRILNATSQSTIVQSVAVGTYTVQVTYTNNTKQGTAVTVGRVQQPGSLGVLSNNTLIFDCKNVNVAWNYNTHNRSILYEVLDTSTPPAVLPAANMKVQESLILGVNSCQVPQPNQTQGLTNPDGSFPSPDLLQMCSAICLPPDANGNPTGQCTTSLAQTWSANGYSVKSATITFSCPGPPTGVP
jgi:Bacterial Ig-like domain (group 2)